MMKIRWKSILCAAALLTLIGGESPGQHDRNRREGRVGQRHFDDHHRRVVFDWYRDNRRHAPRGFRGRDRLAPGFEGRIRAGALLDRDLRRWAYPVPIGLRRSLPPPPYSYRDVVIGGNVVLIDDGYRVRDLIRLDIRL
ncbi:MAG: hypothetical protein HY650_11750 [Acidobacteria bacterium]|nr:hypothetical protein [Acidobacteriota bacterium]